MSIIRQFPGSWCSKVTPFLFCLLWRIDYYYPTQRNTTDKTLFYSRQTFMNFQSKKKSRRPAKRHACLSKTPTAVSVKKTLPLKSPLLRKAPPNALPHR